MAVRASQIARTPPICSGPSWSVTSSVAGWPYLHSAGLVERVLSVVITSRRFEYCPGCANETHQVARAHSLVQIGEEVSLPGRSDVTTYTFFQCPDCGHLWQRIVDSSRGGHGLFLTRLTHS